jgi:hypothetical protein
VHRLPRDRRACRRRARARPALFARGHGLSKRANQVGNFYREDRDVVFPIHAKVIYQGRTRAMISAVETGDCNSCHTESGDMAAPGRILLP